ncbi:MAG TPA: BON domain-containing protein [Gemmatimonadales bacterium]|nr:BON domain-containing protein [Gemmatimonadales bacterium]
MRTRIESPSIGPTSSRSNLIAGAALGAAAMYMLDPERGRRRRSLFRDKAVRSFNKAGDAAGATGRDLRNRTRGLVAEARSKLRSDEPTDAQLAERVRAELGRAASHPGAIAVSAVDGRVTLSGEVLASEAERVETAVRKVRGVTEVNDELQVYDRAGDVPSLQGSVPTRGDRPDFLRTNWSPTTRLVAGLAGAAMAISGLRRRGVLAPVFEAGGLALLARAFSNTGLKRLVGAGGNGDRTARPE